MPRYFFNLTTSYERIHDPEGTELPDEAAAREHARNVAGELMQHRPEQTRSWRFDVCDDDGHPCFDLLFVTVDESLSQYGPEFRQALEDLHEKSASLFETIRAVRRSLLQVKGTMARADGLPYIAAVSGMTVEPWQRVTETGQVA